MSNVLIKGMEMPKRCIEDCKLIVYDDEESEYYCPFTNRVAFRNSRHSGCPLRPLPSEHGRLIDADALVNDCEKYIKTLNPDRDGKEIVKIRWLVGILNEQPTTIEAEGSAE